MSSVERFPCTQKSATAQEVFDRALNHLRAQGCVSMGAVDGVCAYWNDDGLHCGIGIFIRPEEYRSWMEGKRVDALLLSKGCPTRLHNELIVHIARPNGKDSLSLLERIQEIHDQNEPRVWEECFEYLAEDFGLIYTPKAA